MNLTHKRKFQNFHNIHNQVLKPEVSTKFCGCFPKPKVVNEL